MRMSGWVVWSGLLFSNSAFAGVVINEVYPNPSESDDNGKEWIELFNTGTVAVNLSGYTIDSGTSSFSVKYTFPSGASIAPGKWLVVGDAFVTSADFRLPTGATLGLGNGSNSDAVRVRNSGGVVLDTVIYSTPNENGWTDDLGGVATSLAPNPSSGQSLARKSDGLDTNAAGSDFTKTSTPTPGATNGSAPSGSCETGSTVVINELMPDPDGTDDGQEWIEIFNKGSSSANLGGWKIKSGTSSFSTSTTIPSGTSISPGGFLVVGHSGSPSVDVVVASLSLGNASSSGDAIRIEDCNGVVADTVIYGPNNNDNFVDDAGVVGTSVAPKPSPGKPLARVTDGQDTNASASDFALGTYATAGASNAAPGVDCGARTSDVKLNEFLPDPAGTDQGFEWVELYNAGSSTVNLAGWSIQKMTSESFSNIGTFASGVSIASDEWLLVGASSVPGADVLWASLSLPNGTNGDALRLADCAGFPADTVVFGKNNEDLVVDDSGSAATSLASDPPAGVSLQRLKDGEDTDKSGDDFALQESPTPGSANPVIDFDPCVPSNGKVLINEIFPNPEGEDAGLEWVEFYNGSGSPVSLSGWFLSFASTSPDMLGEQDLLFTAGTTAPSEGFFVVGGANVEAADLVRTFSLGNGDKGDAVRLHDCSGVPVDTVIYGDSNDDGMLDDRNVAPVSAYGRPSSDQSLARMADGLDADVDIDWVVDLTPTAGSSNSGSGGSGGNGDDLPGPPGACGCLSSTTGFPGAIGVMLAVAGARRRRSIVCKESS